MWLVTLKAQGNPSGNCGNTFYTMLFALSISADLLLTIIFMCHIGSPIRNWFTFGIPFLMIMPGLVFIAPLWCLLAVMQGSPRMLKTYSTMNACLVLSNYPLTLVWLIWAQEPPFYIAVVALLIMNKVAISSFNGKVRAYLTYPAYTDNLEKFYEVLTEV